MADEELKVLLRENIEISRESLKILKKINRGRILSSIFSALKWTLIIGISFGAYYYIEPYLSKYIDRIINLAPGVEKVGEISNNADSEVSSDLLKKLQNLMPK